MSKVGYVSIQVGLARFTRSKFDKVNIVLNKRNATAQIEHLLPPRHGFWIKAARVDQNVYPFIGAELSTFLNILIQIDHADLKWCESGNFEGSDFFVVNFGFVICKFDRSPHPT